MDAGGFFTGIIGILLIAVIGTIMILWIVFPVMVLSKFNELMKLQREMLHELKWARDHMAFMRKGYEQSLEPPAVPRISDLDEPKPESLRAKN